MVFVGSITRLLCVGSRVVGLRRSIVEASGGSRPAALPHVAAAVWPCRNAGQVNGENLVPSWAVMRGRWRMESGVVDEDVDGPGVLPPGRRRT